MGVHNSSVSGPAPITALIRLFSPSASSSGRFPWQRVQMPNVEMQLVDFVVPACLNDREPEPRCKARFEIPCLLRLLPAAGAVAGRGLHPLEKRRLVTAHVESGHSAQRQMSLKTGTRAGPFLVRMFAGLFQWDCNLK